MSQFSTALFSVLVSTYLFVFYLNFVLDFSFGFGYGLLAFVIFWCLFAWFWVEVCFVWFFVLILFG